MTDPRRPRGSNQARQELEADQPRAGYQPRTDPAYSGQVPSGPPYGTTFPPRRHPDARTERLPQYWQQDQSSTQWQYGQFPPAEPPQGEPPRRPSTPPRWLWIAAGAAVLLVVALVIALVIANGTAKRETAVPPLPAMPGSTSRPSSPPTSASPRTSTPPSATATSPAPSTAAPQTSTAGPSETVDYNVTGEGRAISISYVDDDGIMQIEFNVALPWSKEVSLPRSGNQHPAVTIVNIGHNVSCSVTVDGVRGRQRNGVGLTVCDAPK